jgi:hypothetical protein
MKDEKTPEASAFEKLLPAIKGALARTVEMDLGYLNAKYDGNIPEDVLTPEKRQELLDLIRRNYTASLADELVSVQPMNNEALKEIIENSMDEKDLIEQGYEPVCEFTRLMWRKK